MSQTVERAISILEHVSDHPRSLVEIANRLEVHKSTALRLVQTLSSGGLLRRHSDGRYGLGYRLIGLADQATEQFDLRGSAQPHLIGLGERCGYTVHLAAVAEDRIVYVDKVDPSVGSIRLYSRIGRPVQLHTAGVSKAILAHLPQPRRDTLLAACAFERFTSTTIASRAAFEDELRETAARGWALDDGEFEDFINCVAAPILDHTGTVIAAVSITALRSQADLATLKRDVLADLRATAETISRDLGRVI